MKKRIGNRLSIVYVDNELGDDRYDGASPIPQPKDMGPKKTLTEGIQCTKAGGYCILGPGVYREHDLQITKSIHIIGAGPDQCTLMGQVSPLWQKGFIINSPGVEVNNISVRAFHYGIFVLEGSPKLTNMIISDGVFGLVVQRSCPALINCTIADNDYMGVFCYEQAHPFLKNNIIVRNGKYGLYSSDRHSRLAYNNIWGQRYNYRVSYPGIGDLAEDPKFLRRYHLPAHSPSRHAGEVAESARNQDGSRNDQGAYGGPEAYSAKEYYVYPRLLAIPKIAEALRLRPEDKEPLLQAIRDLEWQNTAHWDEWEPVNLPTLSLVQLETLWRRRVALALYQEVNQVYAWSLQDIKPTALQLLLRFDRGCLDRPWSSYQMTSFLENPFGTEFITLDEANDQYTFEHSVWSSNPLAAAGIAKEIRDRFACSVPREAAAACLEYFRELNFRHIQTNDPAWQELPPHEGLFNKRCWNYQDYFVARKTACGTMSGLLRESLRAFNIPAAGGTAFWAGAHQGLYLPSLELIIDHSDDVYSYPLLYMPAIHTFIRKNWYDAYAALGELTYRFELQKKRFLDWFSYYQDPVYGPQLKNEFEYGMTHERGHFYNSLFLPLVIGEDQLTLSEDQEIAVWLDRLAAYYADDKVLVPNVRHSPYI